LTAGFVADEPQSFLLTAAAGIGVFRGGDTSLSGDLRTWGELYQAVLAVLGIGVIGMGGLWLGAGKIVGLHPADPPRPSSPPTGLRYSGRTRRLGRLVGAHRQHLRQVRHAACGADGP
jgi:hypothetical protein